MLFSLGPSLLLCAFLLTGLGWPVAARLELAPAEKLVAALVLSLLGVFLLGWAAFVAGAPAGLHLLLPALAAGGLIWRRREFAVLARDPAVRELAVAQGLVTAGCLGWLATVVSYSGGGWAGDWFEHWERARHYLTRGPADALFIAHAGVTARPPLANVVTAVLLSLTRADFAHYQLHSTLLASLAFAPAALWAQRWGGPTAVRVAAVLFLLNPLFVQNATFAWTKLPAACLVLAAAWFFVRAAESHRPAPAALLGTAALAGALLTHYSAGPVAIVLAGAWLAWSYARRGEAAWWRATAGAAALGVALLATWFGWALAVYGPGGTLLANTSVQAAAPSFADQLARIALNLRDTLVPHFLRAVDPALIAQTSPWGAARDWWFQLYQVNLLFAFGATGWLVLLLALTRAARPLPPARRNGWLAAVAATVVLGVAVHGARDTWGLTHICLQPLVLLGLAVLAAHWPDLPRGWRLAAIAGAAVDTLLGLALHFGVQSLALDHWLAPGRTFDAIFAGYNATAFMNVAAKVQHQLAFFADAVAPVRALLPLWLAAVLTLALWRARRSVHER